MFLPTFQILHVLQTGIRGFHYLQVHESISYVHKISRTLASAIVTRYVYCSTQEWNKAVEVIYHM